MKLLQCIVGVAALASMASALEITGVMLVLGDADQTEVTYLDASETDNPGQKLMFTYTMDVDETVTMAEVYQTSSMNQGGAFTTGCTTTDGGSPTEGCVGGCEGDALIFADGEGSLDFRTVPTAGMEGEWTVMLTSSVEDVEPVSAVMEVTLFKSCSSWMDGVPNPIINVNANDETCMITIFAGCEADMAGTLYPAPALQEVGIYSGYNSDWASETTMLDSAETDDGLMTSATAQGGIEIDAIGFPHDLRVALAIRQSVEDLSGMSTEDLEALGPDDERLQDWQNINIMLEYNEELNMPGCPDFTTFCAAPSDAAMWPTLPTGFDAMDSSLITCTQMASAGEANSAGDTCRPDNVLPTGNNYLELQFLCDNVCTQSYTVDGEVDFEPEEPKILRCFADSMGWQEIDENGIPTGAFPECDCGDSGDGASSVSMSAGLAALLVVAVKMMA